MSNSCGISHHNANNAHGIHKYHFYFSALGSACAANKLEIRDVARWARVHPSSPWGLWASFDRKVIGTYIDREGPKVALSGIFRSQIAHAKESYRTKTGTLSTTEYLPQLDSLRSGVRFALSEL